MKLIVRIFVMSLLATAATFVQAQSPTATPADKSASSAVARNDVYHVYFGKAAPGKAAQMADMLKTPNPKDPMPGHFVLLRHQEGDSWDYCLITHMGTKATVDATPFQVPANLRGVTEWHNDTFVNGPSWAEFTKALAISDDAKAKSGDSVYVVSVYRPVPGHREELEKFLSGPPNRPSDTSAGTVLMQHLEGGAWTFLTVVRYNSWSDFGTNDMNNVAQSNKNSGGWFDLRENTAFHTDTLTNRLAP